MTQVVSAKRFIKFCDELSPNGSSLQDRFPKWSSWITEDLRIIWDFNEKENKIILLFAITQHSGSHKEYK